MYQPTEVRTRLALHDDAPRIAAIYNQGIEERVATFETRLRSVGEMRATIASDYPMLVATGVDDAVLGWASLSVYRSRACYAGVAEFSIYLDRPTRGRGIGKPTARVFLFNPASRALCRTCGFWGSWHLRKARPVGRRMARCSDLT